MIEALDLLAENEILEQGRSTLSCAETVLVLDRATNVGGQIDVLVVEVELGEEFFGVGSSISVCATLDVRIGGLASHIRTGSIGNANKARDEGKDMHCDSQII